MELDYTKYEKESLQFVYNESQKHLDEITRSFREVNSKSYLVIGLLFSFLGILISEIITKNEILNLHGLPFLFLIYPTLLISRNLFPAGYTFPGASPTALICDYFEESKENQFEKYLAQRIEDTEKAIINNSTILVSRAKRLKSAMILILTALITSFICWFCLLVGLRHLM